MKYGTPEIIKDLVRELMANTKANFIFKSNFAGKPYGFSRKSFNNV